MTGGRDDYAHKYILDETGDFPQILLIFGVDETGAAELFQRHYHAKGQILAVDSPEHGETTEQRFFYLHDRLGSVRQIIDADADVYAGYIYEPFGSFRWASQRTSTTEPLVNALYNLYFFANYRLDPVTNQYHCHARQYDPTIARFTATDPVHGKFKEPLTLHAYLYCLSDPVNLMDPSGNMSIGGMMASTAARAWGYAQDAGMALWVKFKVLTQLRWALVGANALHSGLINAYFGPDSVSEETRFLIGAFAGGVEMALMLNYPGHAVAHKSIGTLIQSTLNEAASSKPFWTINTAGRIAVDVGLTAVLTGWLQHVGNRSDDYWRAELTDQEATILSLAVTSAKATVDDLIDFFKDDPWPFL